MHARTFDQPWRSRDRTPHGSRGVLRQIKLQAYALLSDEALVRRTRARDFTAFDALVARYRNRLYTLAYTSLGNADDAAAAMYDMVLSAFRDVDSFNDRCSPGTWLYLHGIRAVISRLCSEE